MAEKIVGFDAFSAFGSKLNNWLHFNFNAINKKQKLLEERIKILEAQVSGVVSSEDVEDTTEYENVF